MGTEEINTHQYYLHACGSNTSQHRSRQSQVHRQQPAQLYSPRPLLNQKGPRKFKALLITSLKFFTIIEHRAPIFLPWVLQIVQPVLTSPTKTHWPKHSWNELASFKLSLLRAISSGVGLERRLGKIFYLTREWRSGRHWWELTGLWCCCRHSLGDIRSGFLVLESGQPESWTLKQPTHKTNPGGRSRLPTSFRFLPTKSISSNSLWAKLQVHSFRVFFKKKGLRGLPWWSSG